MTKRIIIMNFDIESKSYQAFSEIKKMQAERQLKGEQMAVVTHVNDGQHQFKINDFIDFTGNNHTSKDSMIGMLVGILGGPLGILLAGLLEVCMVQAKMPKKFKKHKRFLNM